MRRKVALILAILLALAIYGVPAFSKRLDKRASGFHVIKKLPVNMVAGSTYEWEVSFVNPKSEEGWMNVMLEVTEEKTFVGLGEFWIKGTLEAYDNPPRKHFISTITFTEIEGGIFQSQMPIQERFNRITLRISSVPKLMPGTYTFTLTATLQYKD